MFVLSLLPILVIPLESPYHPPTEQEPPPEPDVSLWLRIKRWIVGSIGGAAILWAIYVSFRVITQRSIAQGWPLLIGTLVVFVIGIFALRLSLRGSNKDIKDFSLIP